MFTPELALLYIVMYVWANTCLACSCFARAYTNERPNRRFGYLLGGVLFTVMALGPTIYFSF